MHSQKTTRSTTRSRRWRQWHSKDRRPLKFIGCGIGCHRWNTVHWTTAGREHHSMTSSWIVGIATLQVRCNASHIWRNRCGDFIEKSRMSVAATGRSQLTVDQHAASTLLAIIQWGFECVDHSQLHASQASISFVTRTKWVGERVARPQYTFSVTWSICISLQIHVNIGYCGDWQSSRQVWKV